MKSSLLPQASMLCREESVATIHSSSAKNVRPGMLQLSSPLCWCNTFASSATGHLVEIKNIVESYCLFSKEKKRQEPMSEREGKGKAETWAHKPDVENKDRLCFTSFIPSTNKRLITVLSLNCKICFVGSTAHFFPHVTQLSIFLKSSSGDAPIMYLSLDETCLVTNSHSAHTSILTLQKHLQRHSYIIKTSLGYIIDVALMSLCTQTK